MEGFDFLERMCSNGTESDSRRLRPMRWVQVQDTLHYVEKAAEQLLLLSDLRMECDSALADGETDSPHNFHSLCASFAPPACIISIQLCASASWRGYSHA